MREHQIDRLVPFNHDGLDSLFLPQSVAEAVAAVEVEEMFEGHDLHMQFGRVGLSDDIGLSVIVFFRSATFAFCMVVNFTWKPLEKSCHWQFC